MSKLFSVFLLAVSMYGYMQLISQKVKADFAPAIIYSFIGSAMFLGGIFDIMPLAAKLILYGGIACAVYCVYKKYPIKSIITPGTVFFAVMFCVFVYILYGAVFVEQDNFTHWAYAAKILIRNDRFINMSDPYIYFCSYPLGSQSLIYFFCKVLGADSEWFQMLVQDTYMVAMLLPLFAFAKNIKGYIFSAVSLVLILAGNVGFNELLVDTVLGAAGFGGIAFCVYYRRELKEKIWFTIPVMILLMAVKNSGLFFGAAMIVYMLVYTVKTDRTLPGFGRLIAVGATPFISLFMWQYHVKATFTDGRIGKHSMTIENFEAIFGDKTAEDIRSILHSFAGEVFSLKNPILYAVIFCALIYLLNRFIFTSDLNRFYSAAVLCFALYIAYEIGMLGMFMLTMPTNEALVLACYDRYLNTIVMCCAGVLAIGVMDAGLLCGNDGIKAKIITPAVAAVLSVITIYGCLTPHLSFYRRQQLNPNHHRAQLNQMITENNLLENAGYVIIIDDDYFPRDPLDFTAKYLLGNSAKTRYLHSVKEDPSIFDKYPYVIMYSTSDEVREYVESIFTEGVPRVFYGPDYR